MGVLPPSLAKPEVGKPAAASPTPGVHELVMEGEPILDPLEGVRRCPAPRLAGVGGRALVGTDGCGDVGVGGKGIVGGGGKVLGVSGAWPGGGERPGVLAAEEGDAAGGGGSERYIMLWTEVMPDGDTTVETAPFEVGQAGLRRAAMTGARGATRGGAISFLV